LTAEWQADNAFSKLECGVSILLASWISAIERKLEAYATQPPDPRSKLVMSTSHASTPCEDAPVCELEFVEAADAETGGSAPADSAAAESKLAQSHHVTFLIISLAVLLLSLVLHTEGEQQVVMPLVNVPLPALCTSQRLLGIDCPGCGLTRCFISLAHGDVTRAWHFNPAGFLIFGLVVAQIPYRAVQLWRISRGADQLRPRNVDLFLWIVLVAMLTQWIIRLSIRFF
jgi:cytochrome b561